MKVGPTIGLVVAALAFLPDAGAAPAPSAPRMAAIAVFPVENLSAGGVPADTVRQFLIGNLAAKGIRVLDDAALSAFMTRHRVRYAAGIDTPTAEALRKEAGIDGVLIPSFELFSGVAPPKIALVVRLVSIDAVPTVVWAEDAGLAGDDAPGFFERGVVNDYATLERRALERMWSSLEAYLETGQAKSRVSRARKFRPRAAFRSAAIETGRSASIAVVPFFNVSDRRNAGEILALLFIRHLTAFEGIRVVDTGVVRQQLLDARIIMDGGLSLRDADTVAALVEADFVLGGRILRYEDHVGSGRAPRVEFSTLLIDRKSRRVIWSSSSDNHGLDGVHFFERGTSRTAHAMATQMVRLTSEMIVGRDR